MAEIGQESYVQLVTFTRDGRPKPAPIWIADLADGRLGFTTGAMSWKAKRIRHTPGVELRASDRRGKVTPGARVLRGHAQIASPTEHAQIKHAIGQKYGWQFRLIQGIADLVKVFGGSGGSDAAIVISIESERSVSADRGKKTP